MKDTKITKRVDRAFAPVDEIARSGFYGIVYGLDSSRGVLQTALLPGMRVPIQRVA